MITHTYFPYTIEHSICLRYLMQQTAMNDTCVKVFSVRSTNHVYYRGIYFYQYNHAPRLVLWWKIHVNFYYWNNYRKNFPRYIFVLFFLLILIKIDALSSVIVIKNFAAPCMRVHVYTTDWFFVCFVNRYCFLFYFALL